MRIRHLSIRNFRGIRQLDWALPEASLACLIGRGDSTKSTILEAIRRAFYPQWNLDFNDADFFNCVPANAIRIGAVVVGIPDAFRDLTLSYGQHLSGWDPAQKAPTPDPGEGIEDAIRVRLAVNADLEPTWHIVKSDADEGVPFRAGDRAKVSVSLIGALPDRHLTWSRGSLLNRMTKAENLASSLAEAGRAAKAALELRRAQSLGEFDAVAGTAEGTAHALGVAVSTSYKAHLDSEAINVQVGGLALHDGEMPLRQLGLGSKRMLLTGLQKETLQTPHVTLFDEVEIGLEPHRIARLLDHLRKDARGQYLLTTHSPVVLRELDVENLHVVHSRSGVTTIVSAAQPGLAGLVQGRIRAGAEAFLAPKVVVCEGATEAGVLRGLDDYWIMRKRRSFAYQGVAAFNAGNGQQARRSAEALRHLHYQVAVLVDSDRQTEFSNDDEAALRALGVHVTRWSGGMSIEQRAFADMPWPSVVKSFELASELSGDPDTTLQQVRSAYGSGLSEDVRSWTDHPALRSALGNAAKGSSWFKQLGRGQRWAGVFAPDLEHSEVAQNDMFVKISALRQWIDRE